MHSLNRSLLLLAGIGAAIAAQVPLTFDRTAPPLLAPESASSFISHDTFTTLSHPDFTSHSVRIKRTTGWCDSDVRSYSGYLDVGSKSTFFWYFDSRTAPQDADLMLWTNGGPGCSSSMGLLMELGPCRVQSDANSTKSNPYSWTETFNMIFIDQPIGVGFSHGSPGVFVDTTEQAAIDVHAFLVIFFATFDEFVGRPFHIAGESYGGRYLPLFATEIVHHNQLIQQRNDTKHAPINLVSVLIGNGLTDMVSMGLSYYEQSCSATNGVGKPVLNIRSCVAMQEDVKRCTKWLQKACRTSLSHPECEIALGYCGEKLEEPFFAGELNPYDISKRCTTLGEDLCYPETTVISTYLDQPWVRQTLGVDDSVGPFASCSNKVGTAFNRRADVLAPTFYHLTGLLELGIRVLIYVGELDWICNFRGNYALVQDLQWSGGDAFAATPLRSWSVNGTVAGDTKSSGALTYLTIKNAGHMVPFDKPVEALTMVQRWVAGGKF